MDDLISRKLVIDSFKFDDDGTLWSMDEIVYRLEQFPSVDEDHSAQPEIAKRTAESEQNVSAGDLISRKSVIESLSYCQTYLFDSRDKDKKISLENAEDTIKQLPSAQPEQRWIPCEEQLPDEDILTGRKKLSAEVLMTVVNTIDDETIIEYGSTINGEWYSDRTECFIPHFWKVVAWMPLPEPYQEEGGE